MALKKKKIIPNSNPNPNLNINNLQDVSWEKGLSFVHINIRSLFPKIDQLCCELANSKIGILTLSETWLTDKIDSMMVQIPGYTLYRLDRNTSSKKRGGGLATFINNALSADIGILQGEEAGNKHIEVQWLKLKRSRAKNIILCNLYRPPSSKLTLALKKLTEKLQKITNLETLMPITKTKRVQPTKN